MEGREDYDDGTQWVQGRDGLYLDTEREDSLRPPGIGPGPWLEAETYWRWPFPIWLRHISVDEYESNPGLWLLDPRYWWWRREEVDGEYDDKHWHFVEERRMVEANRKMRLPRPPAGLRLFYPVATRVKNNNPATRHQVLILWFVHGMPIAVWKPNAPISDRPRPGQAVIIDKAFREEAYTRTFWWEDRHEWIGNLARRGERRATAATPEAFNQTWFMNIDIILPNLLKVMTLNRLSETAKPYWTAENCVSVYRWLSSLAHDTVRPYTVGDLLMRMKREGATALRRQNAMRSHYGFV